MKYKEFVSWCSDRACDGCWSLFDALACIDIIKKIDKKFFLNREKYWKKIDSDYGISENIRKREELTSNE